MALIKAIVTAPDNIHLPVLGIKYQGKLIFPVGKFLGT
jgi:hypothetical protein